MKPTTPKIRTVTPKANYVLKIEFENGELLNFDVSPYLNKGIFKELKDKHYFKQVKTIASYGVEWPHQQDLSADTLYLNSMRHILLDSGAKA